jgi:hypothetical protein
VSRRSTAVRLLLAAAALASACRRGDRATPEQMRAQIAALEAERTTLRGKLDVLLRENPVLDGMPNKPVRVGLPTALAGELMNKLLTEFMDQFTLELKNIKVNKKGTVKKVLTLGDYELHVRINKISAKLRTGDAKLAFGGNQISMAMPVTVPSGTGQATIEFKWDGKNVSDAVCGDMEIKQDFSGGVVPTTYPVSGAILLTATAREIVAQPKLPQTRIKIRVKPSPESWAVVEKIIADKTGMCGYVLDKVNLIKILQGLIDRGFNVRLPVEKIKPMALPVGIEPSLQVRGQPVELSIKVGELAITKEMIWLGADVAVEMASAAGPSPSTTAAPSPAPSETPSKP